MADKCFILENSKDGVGVVVTELADLVMCLDDMPRKPRVVQSMDDWASSSGSVIVIKGQIVKKRQISTLRKGE